MTRTAARTERNRRSTKELRKAILVAARDLFAAYGYAGTSTRDVAKRAGCVEQLIYKHFGSKASLFAAAVLEPLNEALAQQIERYQQGFMASESADDALRMFVDSMMSVVFAEKKSLLAFMNVVAYQPESFSGGGTAPMAILVEHMRKLEEIGRSAESGRELEVEDWMMETRLAVAMIMSAGILEDILFKPKERDRSRMRHSVFKLLRRGLGRAQSK